MSIVIPRVTLDTNLPIEYLKAQEKSDVVERLLQLARDGLLDLAVTARIHEDVTHPPLSERIEALLGQDIQEIGSVTRLGYWELGRDMLGSDEFVETSAALDAGLERQGRRPPDWRDWDHIHAHYLAGRDVFLTWDKDVLSLEEQLRTRLGIIVMKPEDYLAADR